MEVIKTILFCFIILLFISRSFAQESGISFEHLDVDKSVTKNKITALYQDGMGYLWIGTRSGVYIYNGYNFKNYYSTNDTTSLSSNEIIFIYEERNGVIWVGTSAGLNKFDRKKHNFKRYFYTHIKNSCVNPRMVYSMSEDFEGNLFVNVNNQPYFYDRNKDRFIRLNKNENAGQFFVIDNSFCFISNGRIILTTNSKITGNITESGDYFSAGEKRTSINLEGLSLGGINTVFKDRNRDLWAGTIFGCIIKLKMNLLNQYSEKDIILKNEKKGKYKIFQLPYEKIKSLSGSITCIYEDRESNLWVGTDGAGLFLYNPEEDKFIRYLYNQWEPSGISNNKISSILEDKNGNLWIGTLGGGLNKVLKGKTSFVFTSLPSLPGSNTESKPDAANCFYEDENGILWIGSNLGLYKIDRKKSRKQFFFVPSDMHIPPKPVIRNITEDESGRLWVASFYDLFRFDKKNNKFYKFEGILPSKNIYKMILDMVKGKDCLWVGNDKLHRINLSDFSVKTFDIPFRDSLGKAISVKKILNDNDENLFIICGYTILRFNIKNEKFDFPGIIKRNLNGIDDQKNRNVYNLITLAKDNNGNIWTSDNLPGILKYNFNKDTSSSAFTGITFNNLLDVDIIHSILCDRLGNLWLSTRNSGIWKYNPNTALLTGFGEECGNTIDSYLLNGYKSKNGEMFFCTDGGFVSFFPDDIKKDSSIPPVILSAFKIGEKEINFENDISQITEVSVPFTANNFSFEFVCLDFSNPELNRYQYKLEGFDKDWVDAGTRHYAYYANISGGEYTFRVRTCNAYGVWNMDGLAIKVIIGTHPLQTVLAYIVYFFCLIGAVAGFIFYKNFKNKERIEQLKKYSSEILEIQERERRRIARGLHDSIIQNLFAIKLKFVYFENKLPEKLKPTSEEIKKALDETSQEVREISHNLHPVILDDLGLPEAINRLCREFTNRNGISIIYEQSEIPDNLKSDLQINIYRIIQEALANVEKHAEAKKVILSFQSYDSVMEFMIKDDGKGFDKNFSGTQAGEKVHFGLRNIRDRVDLLNGEINIDSQPLAGTRINIKIPVK
jgi:signal transduction histidine kinase/ligand-binding sensor domain-containing protein